MNNWNLLYKQKMKEMAALKQVSDMDREIGRISYYIDVLTEHCGKLIKKQEDLIDEFGLQPRREPTDNEGQESHNGCDHICGVQDESTAQ